jgi:preprotein translocase subunit SecG
MKAEKLYLFMSVFLHTRFKGAHSGSPGGGVRQGGFFEDRVRANARDRRTSIVGLAV